MPLQATSGAASYDAFGGGVAVVPTYIEDVFSTWLYTGTGANQTITNGVDLSTKGGLVWIKNRVAAGGSSIGWNNLTDTARGVDKALYTNSTNAQASSAYWAVRAFNTNGFNISDGDPFSNYVDSTYASWTFRKQPKFFDVVTYTGNGSTQNIAHSLGSTPGCIIVKCTSNAGQDWFVYHRTQGNGYGLLNTTDSWGTYTGYWNNTAPTSTQFSVGTSTGVNGNGYTYVAYIFAHDAGGFGLTGTDNVISCGSYTGNNSTSGPTVTLGYEPQWILIKASSISFENWILIDNMRGMVVDGSEKVLKPNLSDAEANLACVIPTATGFQVSSTDNAINSSGATYIYIAIRRGPMKVPTSGTSVFTPLTRTGTSAVATVTGVGFPPDLSIINQRTGTPFTRPWFDRLRGALRLIRTNGTQAEVSGTGTLTSFDMDGITLGPDAGGFGTNDAGGPFTYIDYYLRRAPSVFDIVCYKGNGSTQTITHNLGVVPELIIGKNRTTTGNNWPVLFNFASTTMNYGFLNLTNSCPNDTYANVGVFSAAPTSTSMFLVNSGSMNTNTDNHLVYLFATCAGVSKVFSYTGNGSSQTINCGFTGGARFVLIKRTDSTGDWYVWDSARGIVSGNDPHLSLNTTAAEVTSNDTIDTHSTGFVVNQVSATNVNVSSATYIGLAIA
jgi:hypothetical protein